MVVDSVAGLAPDSSDDPLEIRVADLARPPARRADDVVVMHGFASDVGVLAARQIETLDGTQLFEDLERPEDRCPADAHSTASRRREQIGGREMTVLSSDQGSQGLARSSQAIPGAIECGDDR